MRVLLFAVLAGCSGGDGSTRVTASVGFTITESSGIGPSHLDVLLGATVALGIEFSSPSESHDPVGGCPTNQLVQPDTPRQASGDSAATVKTEILDYLPEWRLRLSLCPTATSSSLQLAADNFMNTGFTIGCTELPSAANHRDGDGNPVWSSFTTPATCTMQILDADTNRVLEARGFAVTIEN